MYLVEAWNSPFTEGSMAHSSEKTEVAFAYIQRFHEENKTELASFTPDLTCLYVNVGVVQIFSNQITGCAFCSGMKVTHALAKSSNETTSAAAQ